MTLSSLQSRVLQTLLLPILLFQGKMVRKQAIELPEAEGARKGFCGSGEDLSIIFLGGQAISLHARHCFRPQLGQKLILQWDYLQA